MSNVIEVEVLLDNSLNSELGKRVIRELSNNGTELFWEDAWYPEHLVKESYFVEFIKNRALESGDLSDYISEYIVIDWPATAANLRDKYSSIDIDGETFLYLSS